MEVVPIWKTRVTNSVCLLSLEDGAADDMGDDAGTSETDKHSREMHGDDADQRDGWRDL